MDTEAKKIGQRVALRSAIAGLSIAYLLMVFFLWNGSDPLNSIFWFANSFVLIVLVGSAGILLTAYFLGGRAGTEIIIRGRKASSVGAFTSVTVLWAGTIAGSTIGFILEVMKGLRITGNPFHDYFIKSFFWINFFGLLPALLIGMWFGERVKRIGEEKRNKNASRNDTTL